MAVFGNDTCTSFAVKHRLRMISRKPHRLSDATRINFTESD